jgi:hypothetical protein
MWTYRLEKIEESLRSWATSTEQFLIFVVVYNDDCQMGAECDGIQSKQLPKRVCEVKARLKYTLVPIVVETNCKKAHSELLMQALQVVLNQLMILYLSNIVPGFPLL